ncbi:TadA family conjugal transfer-associated ATPase [Kocuria sp. cx-116]|uniref:TadA family conjugal transfer-associated ATPase n=1 Tax=Kocuria sp. cx-116 TaxID=2771378 RepID=UPI00168724A6|nr:TadA family conjugal transfer-associated ATPase [Kocuria sp. cx-116]MBD2762199.1 TadA family conjugal transfer-associated ATPase [Kocuria sp. cx-116]
MSGTELDPRFLDDVRNRLLQEGGALTDTRIARAIRDTGRVLGAVGSIRAVQHIRAELTGLGPLEPLLPTTGLSDVYVNGHENVFIETLGGVQRVPSPFTAEADVRALAVRLITAAGRRLDDANPCVDVQTATGLRVHAVIPPVSTSGTLLSIRFRAPQRLSLSDLVLRGAMHPFMADVLCSAMRAGANLMISGATGSGKTTVLSALLSQSRPSERLVLIEDAAELDPDHPHVVGLQARHDNVEGSGGVDLAELVRQALRMRPDRLVVGECRGAEVRELLTALNTGHAGAGTVHANSAQAVPARLAALGSLAGMNREAVDLQAFSALDLIAHVSRGPQGRRLETLCTLELSSGRLSTRSALTCVDGEPVKGPGWPRVAQLLSSATTHVRAPEAARTAAASARGAS